MRSLSLVLAAVLIIACGQKGPLYRPDDTAGAADESSTEDSD
jgi:predicted small lipoprotein YifL